MTNPSVPTEAIVLPPSASPPEPSARVVRYGTPIAFSKQLITPASTAIVTMEMQRGMAGDVGVDMPASMAVAEKGVVPRLAHLLDAARAHDMLVIHCVAAFRPDRRGSYSNIPSVGP